MHAFGSVSVDTARSRLVTQGVVAYTDGACIKNPGGPAGWSAILLPANDVTGGIAHQDAACIECYGHIPRSPTTTNNRAEITAVLSVFCISPAEYPLKIFIDREYTIKVCQGAYTMNAKPV